jgi:ATP-binding cassette subfamily B (MDR/TAP) protein 1
MLFSLSSLVKTDWFFRNSRLGAFSIINITPALEAFNKGRGVACDLFDVIERRPAILADGSGEKPSDFKGMIEFRNVSFSYPSRPDVPILKNFSLTIPEVISQMD